MLNLVGKVFLTFWHHHALLRGYWYGSLWGHILFMEMQHPGALCLCLSPTRGPSAHLGPGRLTGPQDAVLDFLSPWLFLPPFLLPSQLVLPKCPSHVRLCDRWGEGASAGPCSRGSVWWCRHVSIR